MSTTVSQMIAEAEARREVLARAESAAHPDLVDGIGRRWFWWKGDLYRHEGKAWTRDLMPGPVESAGVSL